jgi:hypothetical protein
MGLTPATTSRVSRLKILHVINHITDASLEHYALLQLHIVRNNGDHRYKDLAGVPLKIN